MSKLQPPTIATAPVQQTPPWAGQPAPDVPSVVTTPQEVPPAPYIESPETATKDLSAELVQFREASQAITHTGQQVMTEVLDKLPEAIVELGDTELCEDEGCPQHGTEHVCLNLQKLAKVDLSGLFANLGLPPVPHKDEDEAYLARTGRFTQQPEGSPVQLLPCCPIEDGEAEALKDTETALQSFAQLEQGEEIDVLVHTETTGGETYIIDGPIPGLGQVPEVLYPTDIPLGERGYFGCAIRVKVVGLCGLLVDAYPYVYDVPPRKGGRGRAPAHRVNFWEPLQFKFDNHTVRSAIKQALRNVFELQPTEATVAVALATTQRHQHIEVDGKNYNVGTESVKWFGQANLDMLDLNE